MKNVLHFILCLLTVCVLLVTSTAQAQDISINILSASATLPLSTTGGIQVDICNTDPANVPAPANTINPEISVGANVTILGVTNMDGSPLTNFAVVSNRGQVVRLSNSAPLPNLSCLSFKVVVQGKVIDDPGNIVGISAKLDVQNAQTAGNKSFNDKSATSVAVVVNPQLKPDLTPVAYIRPSSIYGNKPVSLVVDILELNSIATRGPITVKITRDAVLSLSFDPTVNQIDGRPLQNSAWNFDDSDFDYYILTTNQVINPGGYISLGLSGLFNPSATTGVVNISTVVMDNGNDQTIGNNVSASKIEYFHQ